MSYSEPRPRPIEELAADLRATDPSVVRAALVDAGHHAPPVWAQPRLVAVAVDHPDLGVRRAALVALSALARRRAIVVDRALRGAIDTALAHEELRGTAEDLLDDVETYGSGR